LGRNRSTKQVTNNPTLGGMVGIIMSYRRIESIFKFMRFYPKMQSLCKLIVAPIKAKAHSEAIINNAPNTIGERLIY
jgi:hypothetical protein